MRRGEVLRVVLDSPRYETEVRRRAAVDAVATHDAEGSVGVRGQPGPREGVLLGLDLRAFPGVTRAERITLAEDDRRAANTAAAPDRVRPRRAEIPVRPGEPPLSSCPRCPGRDPPHLLDENERLTLDGTWN